jgi:hypothetical protein
MSQNSKPPLIQPSTTFDTNYSTLLSVQTLRSSNIYTLNDDGTQGATLSNQTLSGLTDTITDNSDAVNKLYVINSKKPSGPVNSVQYNSNGVFTGSSNFRFVGDFNTGVLTLTDTDITDGILNISKDKVTSLNNGYLGDQAITKGYEDLFSNYTNITTISNNAGITYNGTSIISGLILRSSNINATDTFADATSILLELYKSVGPGPRSSLYSVSVASSTSITLAGTQVIDGVNVLPGLKVLAKDQTNPIENGIYLSGASLWFRSTDMPSGSSAYLSRSFVEQGLQDANKLFLCSNEYSYSIVGTDKLSFKQIEPVTLDSFFKMSIINVSTLGSMINFGTSSGVILSGSSETRIPKDYVLNSFVSVTGLYPPEITVDVLNITQCVVYIQNNFEPDTFQTTLAYKVNDTFMVPGPTSSISLNNTAMNYSYTIDDINQTIMIRNPTTTSTDTFQDLLTNSSFTIQNESSSSITLSNAGSWVFNPTSISIPATHSCLMYLYNENNINYLNVLSLLGM